MTEKNLSGHTFLCYTNITSIMRQHERTYAVQGRRWRAVDSVCMCVYDVPTLRKHGGAFTSATATSPPEEVGKPFID